MLRAKPTAPRTSEQIRREIAEVYRAMQIAVELDDQARFYRACRARERLREELTKVTTTGR